MPREGASDSQVREEYTLQQPSAVAVTFSEACEAQSHQDTLGFIHDGWRLQPGAFMERKKSAAELKSLRLRSGRHLNRLAGNGLQNFYRKQNIIVDYFVEAHSLLEEEGCQGGESSPRSGARDRRERWAMRLSFWTNVALLVLKIFIASSSGSLSIIVSALDSVLDVVSGLILYLTTVAMKRKNKYQFPIGKERMEPLGIIVFSCIMGTVGFTVVVEGVRQLLGRAHTHHLESLLLPVVGMATVIVAKLFLYGFSRNSKSDAVQAYAQDHLNDVCTNSLGLAFALLGDKVAYWLDPVGAILLASWVTFNWGSTAREHALNLVGMSASPAYLSKLTFVCWNHHPEIRQIDTVRAYTFGKNLFAEVDVVLPAEMELRRAHDIGESLQIKLESLPEIERAFVHLDYETGHRPDSEHPATNFHAVALRSSVQAAGSSSESSAIPHGPAQRAESPTAFANSSVYSLESCATAALPGQDRV